MYRIRAYITAPDSAFVLNIDTGQRNFSSVSPTFSFSYSSVIFNDTTAEYFYKTTGGILTALTAPQKAEVQAYVLKLTASDPWAPTLIAAPTVEVPSKTTLAELTAMPTSILLVGTTCYVSDYKARFIWDGTSWSAMSSLVTTWAIVKTLAASFKVGTEVVLTDYGNQRFFTDGTKWRPVGGRALLSSINGRVASPVATLTGVTSGVFGVSTKIPAGMLKAGSRVIVRCHASQSLAFTATVGMYFGVNGSTADTLVSSSSLAATAGQGVRGEYEFYVSSIPTIMTTPQWLAYGAVGTGGLADRTVADTSSLDLFITVGISGGNATNTYSLVSHSVEVLG